MVMEVSPSTKFSMGQFASRHKTALYTFEQQHRYFADGPEVFDESMDEDIGNSFDARPTPKLKASHHRFLKWIAYDRKSAQSLDERAMRTCPIVECKKPYFSSYEAMLQHVHKCKHLLKGSYRCQECNRDFRINRFRDHESHKPQRAQNSLKRVSRSLKSELRSARSLFTSHKTTSLSGTPTDHVSQHQAGRQLLSELPCKQLPQELDSATRTELEASPHFDSSTYGENAATDFAFNNFTCAESDTSKMVAAEEQAQCTASPSIDSRLHHCNDTRIGQDDAMRFQSKSTFQLNQGTAVPSHSKNAHDFRPLTPSQNMGGTPRWNIQTQQSIPKQRNDYENTISLAPSPLSSPIDRFHTFPHTSLPEHIVSPIGSCSSIGEMTRSSTITTSSANTSMTDSLRKDAASGNPKSFIAVLEDTNKEIGEPDGMNQGWEQFPVPVRRPQPRRPRPLGDASTRSVEPDQVVLGTVEGSAASVSENHCFIPTSLYVHGGSQDNDLRAGVDDILIPNHSESLPLSEEELNTMYAPFFGGHAEFHDQGGQDVFETSPFDKGTMDIEALRLPKQESLGLSHVASEYSCYHNVNDVFGLSTRAQTTASPYQTVHSSGAFEENLSSPGFMDTRDAGLLSASPTATSLFTPPSLTPQSSPTVTSSPGTQMTVQSPRSNSVHQCQYCSFIPTGLEKNKRSNLKRHQKHTCKTSPTYVGELKSFRCHYANCTKGYGRRDALLVHQRTEKHDGLTGLDSPVGHNDAGSSQDHIRDEGIYEGSGYGYYEWQDINTQLS